MCLSRAYLYMASNTQYFKDVFDFLCKFRWIFRSSNTRFLVDGVFNEIPPDWVPFLQSLDNQQFNQLPIGLQHVRNHICCCKTYTSLFIFS